MRIIITSAAFLLMTCLFSCDEPWRAFIDCSKCQDSDMEMVEVEVKTDTRYGNVIVCAYEGNLEDNVLLGRYNAGTGKMAIHLLANKRYTFTALYIVGNKNYTAVDSAEPHVGYDKDSCDSPCYYVYGNTVNLKLKYLK